MMAMPLNCKNRWLIFSLVSFSGSIESAPWQQFFRFRRMRHFFGLGAEKFRNTTRISYFPAGAIFFGCEPDGPENKVRWDSDSNFDADEVRKPTIHSSVASLINDVTIVDNGASVVISHVTIYVVAIYDAGVVIYISRA